MKAQELRNDRRRFETNACGHSSDCLNFDSGSGRALDAPSEVRRSRRLIARIKTIQTERGQVKQPPKPSSRGLGLRHPHPSEFNQTVINESK